MGTFTMSHGETSVDERRRRLLRFYATEIPGFEEGASVAGTAADAFMGVYHELPKLELAARGSDPPPVDVGNLRTSIAYLYEREDCAEFGLAALLRVLYDHAGSGRLGGLAAEIADAAAAFTYWLDSGAGMNFWTENHQILFHSCQYLAGQRLPDRTFDNGEDGRWHRDTGRRRVERWLDWRLRFGFSEWHSNSYYEEDVLALANLRDFAADSEIRRKAESVLHLLFFYLAVNAYDGVFGTPHGRAYARHLVDPPSEPVAPLRYLQFGEGSYRAAGLTRGGPILAASDYERPPVLASIAADDGRILDNRERHSLDVKEAEDFGVDPDDRDDLAFFLGTQTYNHREVIETALDTVPESYFLADHLREAYDHYRCQEKRAGSWERLTYEPDPNSQAMTRAALYTHRTPAYMLCCAQEYRPGKVGFQQHVWQATLGEHAPVFTTHPGTERFEGRPNYWHGNGVLPRAVAHRNVALVAYRVEPAAGHPEYTHAFVPRHAFDEWTERADWVFGRRGSGYVALRSAQPTEWRTTDWQANEPTTEYVRRPLDPDGPDLLPYDLVADGTRNVWVCELGREERHGSFGAFVDSVADARIDDGPDAITYESPSIGTVGFGWDRDLTVDGERVPVGDHPRFDNPYCSAAFGETSFEIEHDGERLELPVKSSID